MSIAVIDYDSIYGFQTLGSFDLPCQNAEEEENCASWPQVQGLSTLQALAAGFAGRDRAI